MDISTHDHSRRVSVPQRWRLPETQFGGFAGTINDGYSNPMQRCIFPYPNFFIIIAETELRTANTKRFYFRFLKFIYRNYGCVRTFQPNNLMEGRGKFGWQSQRLGKYYLWLDSPHRPSLSKQNCHCYANCPRMWVTSLDIRGMRIWYKERSGRTAVLEERTLCQVYR